MKTLSESYNKSVQEETRMTQEELANRHVGKQDPKRHLEDRVNEVMQANISQNLATMINSTAF